MRTKENACKLLVGGKLTQVLLGTVRQSLIKNVRHAPFSLADSIYKNLPNGSVDMCQMCTQACSVFTHVSEGTETTWRVLIKELSK